MPFLSGGEFTRLPNEKTTQKKAGKMATLRPIGLTWRFMLCRFTPRVHDLVALARQLATKRPDFDLKGLMHTLAPWVQDDPLTIEEGFGLFNPFFSELRYSQELKTMGGVVESET